MSNFKEIYPSTPFIENLHRMDSLKNDKSMSLVYNGELKDAPTSAEYVWQEVVNTKTVNGRKKITIDDGISMPIESIKIRGESSYKVSDEYVQLDYIESTGSSYFNTGITFDKKGYQFVIDFQITSSSKPDQAICGTYSHENNLCRYRVGYGPCNNFTCSIGTSSLERQTATSVITSGVDSNYNFYIFAKQRYTNGVDSPAIGRVYSCLCYLNGELIKEFIPCYKKKTNEVGMLDTINKVFYTSETSTPFLKGPETVTASITNPVEIYYIGTKQSNGWKTTYSDGTIARSIISFQPLCSLGDTITDYYKDNKIIYNTVFSTLNENMNWIVDNIYTTKSLLVLKSYLSDSTVSSQYLYCTHFTPSDDLTKANHIKIANRYIYITMNTSDIKDKDSFLDWVKDKEVIIIYQRKLPLTENIEGDMYINTYEGTTSVTNNQNALMEIEYRISPNAILYHKTDENEYERVVS